LLRALKYSFLGESVLVENFRILLLFFSTKKTAAADKRIGDK
jgi:hypothetical protein